MENFKAFDEILEPDIRMTCQVWVDLDTGEQKRKTQQDHYAQVVRYELDRTVPEEICSQFNTAKNLLLYTWYAYHLLSSAELQVLIVLEAALRKRIGEEKIKELTKQKKRGLHAYIKHAIEKNWISNADFRAWHRAPILQARDKYLFSKIDEMKAGGLDLIDIDLSEVEQSKNNTLDYLVILQGTVNKIRNWHGHGELMLHEPSVWTSFEMTTDFINALFRKMD